MSKQKQKTTHSGIRIEGNWEEICGFARDLERILKESYEKEDTAENMDDSIEGYNKWRPREEEDEKDLSKRTAEQAAIKKKGVEKDFKGTNEELKSAGKKVKKGINGAKDKGKSAIVELKDNASKGMNNLINNKSKKSQKNVDRTEENTDPPDKKKEIKGTEENKSPSAELKDASKSINRLIGSKSIESLRKMEEAIYEQVMLKLNPYYFDTEHFSINLEEKDDDHYLLTVNIPDDELRKTIKRGLREKGK
ncbi:MAG: DUF5828 family protein [Thermoplasmata archaeon]